MTPRPDPARALGDAAARANHRRHLLLIPLVALFVVHPLIMHGASCGHDFDFHLVNWMEAASQFSQGTLHPHWAFTPAFNAGEPRFVFYPPLSWVVGAVLGLLLTHIPGVSLAAAWSAVPIVFTWIALSLSGLTMYRLARTFASANAALLAAILYLANPYMMFTAYERTAYAELLAAAWIPLLLLGILRARITIPGIALPVALLWLTNAPAAVMGCYTLALLAFLRVALTLRTRQPASLRTGSALSIALRALAGAALGLGLAAFYIVPANYERRFVQISMATIAGMRIDQNFLFEHTGTSPDALLHDQVLRTASFIAVVLLAAAAVALATILIRRQPANTSSDSASNASSSAPLRKLRGEEIPAPDFPVAQLAVLTAAIAFLLTPLSARVWMHAPEMAFLQFPWRLLAILAPILALAIAVALRNIPLKFEASAVIAIALAAALALPAYHLFRQQNYPEDTAPAQLAAFQSHAGTDPTDEYTPASADNDALGQNDPPYWLAANATMAAPTAAPTGSAPTHLTVTAPQPEFLILNLRDYPAWRIFRNGTLDTDREQRDDGLIALPVPLGNSVIDVRYAHTTDQTLGDLVTLLAFLVLLPLLFTHRTRIARH